MPTTTERFPWTQPRTDVLGPLVTYTVTLGTRFGPAVLEVPSTFGPDAAARRAIFVGAALRWDDVDRLTIVSVTPLDT